MGEEAPGMCEREACFIKRLHESSPGGIMRLFEFVNLSASVREQLLKRLQSKLRRHFVKTRIVRNVDEGVHGAHRSLEIKKSIFE
jgi:hypothetical protein